MRSVEVVNVVNDPDDVAHLVHVDLSLRRSLRWASMPKDIDAGFRDDGDRDDDIYPVEVVHRDKWSAKACAFGGTLWNACPIKLPAASPVRYDDEDDRSIQDVAYTVGAPRRHSATRTSRGTALQPLPPLRRGDKCNERSLRSKQLRMMWTCICAWKQMHVYNGICIPSAEPWYQGVSDLLLTVELTTDVTSLLSNLGGNLQCPWRGAEACAVG